MSAALPHERSPSSGADSAAVRGTGTRPSSPKRPGSQLETLPSSGDRHRDFIKLFDALCQCGLSSRFAMHQEDAFQSRNGCRLQPCEQLTLIRVTAQLIQFHDLSAKTVEV